MRKLLLAAMLAGCFAAPAHARLLSVTGKATNRLVYKSPNADLIAAVGSGPIDFSAVIDLGDLTTSKYRNFYDGSLVSISFGGYAAGAAYRAGAFIDLASITLICRHL